jgi:hypothetical protein
VINQGLCSVRGCIACGAMWFCACVVCCALRVACIACLWISMRGCVWCGITWCACCVVCCVLCCVLHACICVEVGGVRGTTALADNAAARQDGKTGCSNCTCGEEYSTVYIRVHSS